MINTKDSFSDINESYQGPLSNVVSTLNSVLVKSDYQTFDLALKTIIGDTTDKQIKLLKNVDKKERKNKELENMLSEVKEQFQNESTRLGTEILELRNENQILKRKLNQKKQKLVLEKSRCKNFERQLDEEKLYSLRKDDLILSEKNKNKEEDKKPSTQIEKHTSNPRMRLVQLEKERDIKDSEILSLKKENKELYSRLSRFTTIDYSNDLSSFTDQKANSLFHATIENQNNKIRKELGEIRLENSKLKKEEEIMKNRVATFEEENRFLKQQSQSSSNESNTVTILKNELRILKEQFFSLQSEYSKFIEHNHESLYSFIQRASSLLQIDVSINDNQGINELDANLDMLLETMKRHMGDEKHTNNDLEYSNLLIDLKSQIKKLNLKLKDKENEKNEMKKLYEKRIDDLKIDNRDIVCQKKKKILELKRSLYQKELSKSIPSSQNSNVEIKPNQIDSINALTIQQYDSLIETKLAMSNSKNDSLDQKNSILIKELEISKNENHLLNMQIIELQRKIGEMSDKVLRIEEEKNEAVFQFNRVTHCCNSLQSEFENHSKEYEKKINNLMNEIQKISNNLSNECLARQNEQASFKSKLEISQREKNSIEKKFRKLVSIIDNQINENEELKAITQKVFAKYSNLKEESKNNIENTFHINSSKEINNHVFSVLAAKHQHLIQQYEDLRIENENNIDTISGLTKKSIDDEEIKGRLNGTILILHQKIDFLTQQIQSNAKDSLISVTNQCDNYKSEIESMKSQNENSIVQLRLKFDEEILINNKMNQDKMTKLIETNNEEIIQKEKMISSLNAKIGAFKQKTKNLRKQKKIIGIIPETPVLSSMSIQTEIQSDENENEYEKEIEQLRDQLALFQAEGKIIKNQNTYKDMILVLETTNKELKAQLESANQKITEITNSYTSKLEESQSFYREAEEKLIELEKHNDELSKMVSQMKNDNESKVDSYIQKLSLSNKQVRDKDSEINNLQKKLKELSSENEQKKNLVEKMISKKDYDEISDKYRSLKKANNLLLSKYQNDFHKSITEKEKENLKKIENLTNENQTLTLEIGNLQKSSNTLKEILKQKKINIDFNSLCHKSDYDHLLSQHESLSQSFDKLKIELQNYQNEVENKEQINHELNQELQKARSQVVFCDETISKMKQEYKTMMSQISSIVSKNLPVRELLKSTLNELASYSEKLDFDFPKVEVYNPSFKFVYSMPIYIHNNQSEDINIATQILHDMSDVTGPINPPKRLSKILKLIKKSVFLLKASLEKNTQNLNDVNAIITSQHQLIVSDR